jgi:hypothetical protein
MVGTEHSQRATSLFFTLDIPLCLCIYIYIYIYILQGS